MSQSHHPQQILPSPARLGLTNPNSPSVPNPSTPKLSPTSQQPQQQQQQQTATPTVTKTSSTLLSLLPPLPRAQSLLLQMAALATKLFDISPNRSHWITAFRGSLPSFLPSQTQTQTQTHTADAVSSTKEILSSFTSLQTQLFEAVAQLQEILDLQDAKQKVAHDIRSMDNSILAFTKKLKEAVQVLELLVDDYSDYRQPKRLKSAMGGKFHASKLTPREVRQYRQQEREKMQQTLDEYVLICAGERVQAEKLVIERDDVEKGIVELVIQHGITNLVMGAAADKHYSKKMREPNPRKPFMLPEKPNCHVIYHLYARESLFAPGNHVAGGTEQSDGQHVNFGMRG